jgi:hypothetical protein
MLTPQYPNELTGYPADMKLRQSDVYAHFVTYFPRLNSCEHIFITLWQNLRFLQFLHFILEKVGFKILILLRFLSDIRFTM